MKLPYKLSKTLCVMACLFMGSMFTSAAADFMIDSICYNIIGDNEVEVTRRDVKYSGEIIIPATVMNEGTTYQVTRIGNNAFAGCSNMTLIGIPEGVTSFGNYAFYGCSNLENIDLPNSLVSIDKFAFWGCSSFTQFHVPRGLVDIAYNAFLQCNNISYYTCSSLNPYFKAVDGVLYTKDLTMLYEYPPAATATSFVIPSTVTALHDYCFADNHYLTEVTIPETVTWMGMNIFRGCIELQSAYIPDGVTHMGVTVFGYCSKLSSVHLPASLDSLMSSTFLYCDLITEVTVPSNVSYCDQMAFAYTPALKTVHFEEGSRLKTIGMQAFRECESLEYVDLPDSVESIGAACFYECPKLKWVHVGKNLNHTENDTFAYCDSLRECVVLGSPATIHNLVVSCPQLKKLVIGTKDGPPGTTILENATTFHTYNIEYLELGANIDSLDQGALDLDSIKVFVCWAVNPPRCNAFWGTFGLSAQSKLSPLYVPKASVEAYRVANAWKAFENIVPIDDLGDANGDGLVNMDDLTALINILLTGNIAARDLPLADTNLDGAIGMDDLTTLINILLSGN